MVGPLDGLDPDRTVVDLVDRKLLAFAGESEKWAMKKLDPPDSAMDVIEEWRTKLIDTVCLFDDDAMELYFAEGDIPADQLKTIIRAATLQGQLTPVFCGTSLKCVGVQPVLDGVVDYLPSPLDRPPG